MDLMARAIEEKIQEAIAKGQLKNLPGEGRPLVIEDNSSVPLEMRMSYKVLKNAGYLPREVELQNEIAVLQEQLRGDLLSAADRDALQKKVVLKQAEVSMALERMK